MLSEGSGPRAASEGESAQCTASQTQGARGNITSQLPLWFKKIFRKKNWEKEVSMRYFCEICFVVPVAPSREVPAGHWPKLILYKASTKPC